MIAAKVLANLFPRISAICHSPCAIRLHHLGHLVVIFEDDAFGAVLAFGLLVFAADDGEGVHDVAHRIPQRGEHFEKRGMESREWGMVFRGSILFFVSCIVLLSCSQCRRGNSYGELRMG